MMAAAGRQVRDRGLAEPEHRVDVGLENPVELSGGDPGEAVGLRHLVAGDVGEDVEAAEFGDGPLDQQLAVVLVGDVAGHPDAPPPGVGDEPERLLRVGSSSSWR